MLPSNLLGLVEFSVCYNNNNNNSITKLAKLIIENKNLPSSKTEQDSCGGDSVISKVMKKGPITLQMTKIFIYKELDQIFHIRKNFLQRVYTH